MFVFVPLAWAAPLELWHSWTGVEDTERLAAAVDAWNTSHPETQTRAVEVPEADLSARLEAAVARAVAPDLIIAPHTRARGWVERGLVRPVPAVSDALARWDDAVTVNGRRYGLPVQVTCPAFVATRLTPGSAGSWDLTTPDALEHVSLLPNVALGTSPGPAFDPTDHDITLALYAALGGRLVQDDDLLGFVDPDSVAALTILQTLSDHATAEPGIAALAGQLASRSVASVIADERIEDALPAASDIEVLPLPGHPFARVDALYVLRDDRPVRAFAAEAALRLTADPRGLPPFAEALGYELPGVVRGRRWGPACAGAVPYPTNPGSADAAEAMIPSIEALTRGDVTPAEAARDAHRAYLWRRVARRPGWVLAIVATVALLAATVRTYIRRRQRPERRDPAVLGGP